MTDKKPDPGRTALSTFAQLKALISDQRAVPMLVYLLLFFMFLTMGFSGVLALVLIYLNQDDATDLTKSHYIYQKNTFWYSIGGIVASLLTLGIGIPWLPYVIVIPTFIWILARTVTGYNHLLHMRPHPDPKTLLT